MRRIAVFVLFVIIGIVTTLSAGFSEDTDPFESETLFWQQKKERFSFVITNQLIISNAEVIAGITNWRISNITMVYTFSDAFEDLVSFDPIEVWEKELAEMIFPASWYHLPVETAYILWLRKSLRKASVDLLSEKTLLSFSPDIYKQISQEKRKKEGSLLPEEKKPLSFRVEEWESEFVLSGWFVFRIRYGWIWK
ncbi:MAG: hypothetical protein ACK4HQ_01160, partial [Brevinematales bacterium]